MRRGKLLREVSDAHAATLEARVRAQRSLASLAPTLRDIEGDFSPYPVTMTEALQRNALRGG